jgi:RNA chaperone Hfq
METNLLDRMLDTYQAAHTPVSITLQNKIRVSGRIRAFDSYVIILEGQKREIVYRHAISCLAPSTQEEPKKAPSAIKSPPAKTSRPAKTRARIPQQRPPQQPLHASASESINNNMKEGLLRWMQEHKAAK